MADEPEHFQSCDVCGATVYPEHIEKGLAGDWEGQLLCHHCLAEKKPQPASNTAGPTEPIKLADAPEPGDPRSATAIRSFGGGPGRMGEGLLAKDDKLRRNLLSDSPNATRCRTFHAKLTDAAFAHMNEQINEWVDANEGMQLKFATSCIGVVEGKHSDPHLILTVFY